jgi:molybdopterin synthase catalytic subunit
VAERIRVQTGTFDLNAEVEALRAGRTDIGAIVSFLGLTRDFGDQAGVRAMELEHYPGMTERALAGIVAEARTRWDMLDACVIHRVGRLAPGDPIVLVAVASTHRRDAFEACAFIMDFLKTQAPFWKKEHGADGTHWVEAKDTDDQAASRW